MKNIQQTTTTQISEMTGWVLDWAVGQCLVQEKEITEDQYELGKPFLSGFYLFGKAHEMTGTFDRTRDGNPPHVSHGTGTRWEPQKDWNQAGSIIARHKIRVEPINEDDDNTQWVAKHITSGAEAVGDDPTEASMRCYITKKFGPAMEVPDSVFEQVKMLQIPAKPTIRPYIR